MANKKQLEILKKGVEVWNQWRKDRRDEKIDLVQANLRGASLEGYNFSDANIQGASFKGAKLSGTDFSRAKAGEPLPIIRSQIVMAWFGAGLFGLFLARLGQWLAGPLYHIINGIGFDVTRISVLIFFAGGLAVLLVFIFNRYPEGRMIVLFLFILMFLFGGAVKSPSIINYTDQLFRTTALAIITMAMATRGAIYGIRIGSAFIITAGITTSLTLNSGYTWGDNNYPMSITEAVVVAGIATIIALCIARQIYSKNPHFFDNFLMISFRLEKRYRKTDFQGADLSNANFSEARLKDTLFSNANVTNTCWQHSEHLQSAQLEKTILDDQVVRELLTSGNGQGRSFVGKDFTGASLVSFNLCNADFHKAKLINTNLTKANITGAKLYGAARDDWKIDGIQCEYVFWDAEGKERTPKDRDFRPGEFEELYKQLPTFEYVFEHGFTALDAVVMDRIVAAINEQHPEFELTLDSFHSRGQPHAKFTVLHKEYIEAAKQQVTTDYESRMALLEGKVEQLTKMFAIVGSGNITIQSISGNMILQQAQTIEAGSIVAGNQDQRAITTGRDYFEQIEGQAQVTTGNSGQAPEINDISQLTTKEALQKHYQLLNEKINALRKDQILATDPEVKFKLKHQIQEAEAMLEQIEQRLTEFDMI